MAAIFYKIIVEDTQEDISEKIENFIFEDSAEEDNYVRLPVAANLAPSLDETEYFKTGQILTFTFGYKGGVQSKTHKIRITDIEVKYRDRITMVLKCLDLGTTIKKDRSNKIWENVTSSQIAQQLASKHGLSAVIDNTTNVWEALPQGNKSDLAFLDYLCSRETDGAYICYIRSSTLYFVKRGVDRTSKKTYKYKENITSFEPTIKESIAEANNVSINNEAPVNANNEKPTGTVGDFKHVYDGYANSKGTTPGIPFKIVSVATGSKEESTNVANHLKKSATLKQLVAKLVIEGDPTLEPDQVITIANVAKRFAGNWWITKVTHNLGAGYTTTLDLSKNGTKANTGVKATDANTTVGPADNKNLKALHIYDGYGKEKGQTVDPTGKRIILD